MHPFFIAGREVEMSWVELNELLALGRLIEGGIGAF
jgi:hypothetical protein